MSFIGHCPLLVLAMSGSILGAQPPGGKLAAYDPLFVPSAKGTHFRDFSVADKIRSREIPLRVYLPADTNPAPVVLFSHGLGGTKNGCAYLGRHWAARGYVAVFLQHPGSDDSVWRKEPLAKRMSAMNQAASAANFMLRVEDVPAVLDQLAIWQDEPGHDLRGRLDLSKVGMSGHSFGAVTTQAVSGQSFPAGGQRFTDKRIKAAIAFSPSSPRRGDPKAAFGSVAIPWMLMTGTKDNSPIGDIDVASRLAVYPALPMHDKYELVLKDGQHSAFADGALPGDALRRNPNHHRVILALSTAFWDAYLRKDQEARRWLEGDGPKTVLEPGDSWKAPGNH